MHTTKIKILKTNGNPVEKTSLYLGENNHLILLPRSKWEERRTSGIKLTSSQKPKSKTIIPLKQVGLFVE